MTTPLAAIRAEAERLRSEAQRLCAQSRALRYALQQTRRHIEAERLVAQELLRDGAPITERSPEAPLT